jgi:pseudaminic acid cytidylyltransferase
MAIAIITAKGYSRRLKKKNFRTFFGKPLIAWSILILKKTKIFKKIVVSTESNDISKISNNYGADIIIKRPKSLCGNKISTILVMKHAIKSLIKMNINARLFCCMYPAAPNTNFNNIIMAHKMLKNKNFFVFPATVDSKIFQKGNSKIQKIFSIKKKKINFFFKDAGQFYFSSKKNWLQSRKIIKKNSIIIKINREESVDINTYKDFLKSKKIFKDNNEKKF